MKWDKKREKKRWDKNEKKVDEKNLQERKNENMGQEEQIWEEMRQR